MAMCALCTDSYLGEGINFSITRVDGKIIYFGICDKCYPALFKKVRQQKALGDFKA